MKKYLLLSFIAVYSCSVFAWGLKGHDVVALIGEKHLTPRAKAAVWKLLQGHQPVYYANWLDNVRNDPKYAESVTWHYTNVDEGQTYATMHKPAGGDILDGIRFATAKLKDKQSNDSVKTQYLKYLIHLIGDLHCPMHAGRASDLGGNKRSMKWMGQNTNLHKVWDEYLPEKAHNWSATEWVQFTDLPNPKEARSWAQGTPEIWLQETLKLAQEVYQDSPEGANLSWDYLHQYSPLVEKQFLKGGYRLAAVLNEIFK